MVVKEKPSRAILYSEIINSTQEYFIEKLKNDVADNSLPPELYVLLDPLIKNYFTKFIQSNPNAIYNILDTIERELNKQ